MTERQTDGRTKWTTETIPISALSILTRDKNCRVIDGLNLSTSVGVWRARAFVVFELRCQQRHLHCVLGQVFPSWFAPIPLHWRRNTSAAAQVLTNYSTPFFLFTAFDCWWLFGKKCSVNCSHISVSVVMSYNVYHFELFLLFLTTTRLDWKIAVIRQINSMHCI